MQYPIRLRARGASNGDVMRALAAKRIGYPIAFRHFYEVRVRFGRGEFTQAAATSQVIDLNATYATQGWKPFPDICRRLSGAYGYVVTGIAGTGITGANMQIGYQADPDAFMTTRNVLPANEGLVLPTSGAAENAPAPAVNLAPTLRIAVTGGGTPHVVAIEEGEIWVYIPFEPIPQRGG